jgi:hypothetical protein
MHCITASLQVRPYPKIIITFNDKHIRNTCLNIRYSYFESFKSENIFLIIIIIIVLKRQITIENNDYNLVNLIINKFVGEAQLQTN